MKGIIDNQPFVARGRKETIQISRKRELLVEEIFFVHVFRVVDSFALALPIPSIPVSSFGKLERPGKALGPGFDPRTGTNLSTPRTFPF